jgi:NitT/TauT family transport system substrate-binding protein
MLRRPAIAGLTLAMVATLAAACGDDSSSGGDKLTTIRYGLPTTSYSITTVGIHWAIEQGFFEDEGLDVEVKPLNGSTTPIRAVLNGEIDIAQTGPDTATLAVIAGSPLTVIGSPYQKDASVILGAKNIKSLADLRGKTYAISAPGAASATQIQALLPQYGLTDKDVKLVALGAPDARVRALLGGKVDATGATILVLKPVLDAIAAGEVNVLLKASDAFPDIPLSYDMVTEKMATEKRDLVIRFLRAEFKGYQWAMANPEAAAKIAAKYIKNTPEDLIVSAIRELISIRAFGVDGLTYAGIEQTQAAMAKLGTIPRALDAADVADPRFSQEALGKPVEQSPAEESAAPATPSPSVSATP